MDKRKLGAAGPEVPVICLGGNVFGWTLPEAETFRQLDAALDRGLNFVDTADVYSRWAQGHTGGESETILGRWFSKCGKRKDVILATKVGMLSTRTGLSAANIEAAVNDSLKRLKTDYIDVYFSHLDDDKTPLLDTLGAYQKLITAGKVRVIGASNYTGERLEEALKISAKEGIAGYQVLQPEYNLYDRAGYENDLEPVIKAHKVSVVTYYSLASGFLSGKYRSKADTENSARGAKVSGYLNDRGLRIVKALVKVSERHDTEPAAIALAWLIARPGVTAPIASATSVKQLETLAHATRISLAPEDIALLDEASNPD